MLLPKTFFCQLTITINSNMDEEIQFQQRNTKKYARFIRNELGNDLEKIEGILCFKNKIWVPPGDSRPRILQLYHNSACGGHNGEKKMFKHIKTKYIWKGLTKDIKVFIDKCECCQMNRVNNKKPAGLLQPLPIPGRPWKSISMDFITCLPLSEGYNSILVIVDRFTKYSIFIPCNNTCTTKELADLFLNNVFTFFGTPDDIISDRGVLFTSLFWKEFTRTLGIKVKLSSAYHPETDGQTERTNLTHNNI